jgi:hypothetical protein
MSKKICKPTLSADYFGIWQPCPQLQTSPAVTHFLNIFQNILSLETKGIVMQKERPTGNCGGRRKINDMTSLQYVLLLFLQIDV